MNNRLSPFYKNIALWLLISLVMIFLFNYFNTAEHARSKASLSYSQFLELVKSDKVKSVVLQGEEINGEQKEGQPFKSYAPQDPDLIKLLQRKGVEITAKPKDDSPWYTTLLVSWLPMLVLVGIWIFFMRQMQSGGGKAMSFGKSRARLMTESSVKVTFKDVAGIEEAKEEVAEIIEFLKDPKKFTRLGGRIPKGWQRACGVDRHGHVESPQLVHRPARIRNVLRADLVADPQVQQPHVESLVREVIRHADFHGGVRKDQASLRQTVNEQHGRAATGARPGLVAIVVQQYRDRSMLLRRGIGSVYAVSVLG